MSFLINAFGLSFIHNIIRTLFAKTLRLVWIFFQVENAAGGGEKFMFSKRHLLYIMALFLSIDIIILGVWSGVYPLQAEVVTDS